MVHIVTALFVLLIIFTGHQIVFWHRYQQTMEFIQSQACKDMERLHANHWQEDVSGHYDENKEFDLCGLSLDEANTEVVRYYGQIIIPTVKTFLSTKPFFQGQQMKVILRAIQYMEQAQAKIKLQFPQEQVLDWQNQKLN